MVSEVLCLRNADMRTTPRRFIIGRERCLTKHWWTHDQAPGGLARVPRQEECGARLITKSLPSLSGQRHLRRLSYCAIMFQEHLSYGEKE